MGEERVGSAALEHRLTFWPNKSQLGQVSGT